LSSVPAAVRPAGHDGYVRGIDDARSGAPASADIVEIGGSPGGGAPRRWPRWLPVVVVLLIAAALVARRQAADRAVPQAQPPSSTAAPIYGGPRSAPPAPAPVVVTDLGHPLLDTGPGWELFARGDFGVVRIQPALGRITRTALPLLDSTGPVSFVVGSDRAVVAPFDFVPGYVVADGQPGRPLTGPLGRGGPVFPGPAPGTVWLSATGTSGADAELVRLDGSRTGASVRGPSDFNGGLSADGAGYLLFLGTAGVYDSSAGPTRLVTTGRVLAVGPTRLLAVECDARHRCSRVVMDHAGGARRSLGPAAEGAPGSPLGQISPNGARAAVVDGDAGAVPAVHLIDLVSGADRRLAVPAGHRVDEGGMVWSPDGRWLFVAGELGRLYVVDATTGVVAGLGVDLPVVSQLAVRTG
jgi:hypothetical protein